MCFSSTVFIYNVKVNNTPGGTSPQRRQSFLLWRQPGELAGLVESGKEAAFHNSNCWYKFPSASYSGSKRRQGYRTSVCIWIVLFVSTKIIKMLQE